MPPGAVGGLAKSCMSELMQTAPASALTDQAAAREERHEGGHLRC
jgi:hypothetical protein